MSPSIFADESGDESARERDTRSGRQSIFRDPPDDATDDRDRRSNDHTDHHREPTATESDQHREPTGTVDAPADEEESDDESADATMTVFSGDEVYEIGVDDA